MEKPLLRVIVKRDTPENSVKVGILILQGRRPLHFALPLQEPRTVSTGLKQRAWSGEKSDLFFYNLYSIWISKGSSAASSSLISSAKLHPSARYAAWDSFEE